MSMLESNQESFMVSCRMYESYIHDHTNSDDSALLRKLSRTAVYGYYMWSTLPLTRSMLMRISFLTSISAVWIRTQGTHRPYFREPAISEIQASFSVNLCIFTDMDY